MKKLIKRLLPLVFIIALLLLSSCGTGTASSSSEEEKATPTDIHVTVDILKIGKADCFVINTGIELIMIDTGEEENLLAINSYMTANGYDKINKLIITHYDKDHVGGAYDIINRYGVDTVYESKYTKNTSEYISYHSVISENNVNLLKLNSDTVFESGDCEIEINVPKAKKYSSDKDNNTSLVISLRVGDYSVLFMGDALGERISEIINVNTEKYDVIKLPHHGSYIENLKELLDATSPKYAIATDSKKNPTDDETLKALSSKDVRLYRTQNGGIKIEITNDNLNIYQ